MLLDVADMHFFCFFTCMWVSFPEFQKESYMVWSLVWTTNLEFPWSVAVSCGIKDGGSL